VQRGKFPCPHCGRPQPTPPPASFRRVLVLLIGLEIFLLSVLTINLLSRAIPLVTTAGAAIDAALGFWGLAYSIYLWVSFFLIASLRLPGCEFTALNHVVRGKNMHWCVDSVLNEVLDEMQEKKGLGIELLKTDSARKWTLGLAALTVFLAFLLGNFVKPGWGAAAVGIFTLFYLAYDKTIHGVSIDSRWLTGHGDYKKAFWVFLKGKKGAEVVGQ
jgi:hypothetical protein